MAVKILLADDDSDDRYLFDKALKEIAIPTQLTTVSDGELLMDCLSENSEHLPDVLFLDLSMPRKTGFECLTEIKGNEKFKNIPVIVFTTSFGRGDEYEQNLINTLSGLGAREYIRKPYDFQTLKETIEKTLARIIETDPLKQPEKIA